MVDEGLCKLLLYIFFFFNDTATTEIYTLSLHDALPIYQRKLRCRHGAAAVIVRMDAEGERLAVAEVAMAPLDLVGVDVRGAHLDGGRQVEDDSVLATGPPDVHHRLADLLCEIQLRAGEAFG